MLKIWGFLGSINLCDGAQNFIISSIIVVKC